MITEKTVYSLTQQASGPLRARMRYTFGDGTVIKTGPYSVMSAAQANKILDDSEQSVIDRKIRTDALEAISLNIKTAHKDANTKDVQLEWMRLSNAETEAYKAYDIMAEIAGDVLALGLDAAGYASHYGVTVEEAQDMLNKWSHLDANKTILDSYRSVVEGV